MTEYVLSIDPGLSTGISLLSYTPDANPVLEYVTQFGGGAEAVERWLHTTPLPLRLAGTPIYGMAGEIRFKNASILTEAFTARNTKGFSYTTDSLEALPVIGVLVAHGLVNRKDRKTYRDPNLQYLVGGKGKADKKKRQHQFLEDAGYYIGRKEIGQTLKDYDDARSSVAHALNYLAREVKHKPTFDMIQEWSDRNAG